MCRAKKFAHTNDFHAWEAWPLWENVVIATRKVALKLDFIKPFEGHNMVEFTVETQRDAITVMQAMSGESNLFTS